jgi:hypothetical protein
MILQQGEILKSGTIIQMTKSLYGTGSFNAIIPENTLIQLQDDADVKTDLSSKAQFINLMINGLEYFTFQEVNLCVPVHSFGIYSED